MNTFIARNGEQIGSWLEEQVREFYRVGKLFPTDVYWQDGMTEWRPITDLPGLVASTLASTPVFPSAPTSPQPSPTGPPLIRAPLEEPPPSRLSWFAPFLVAVAAAVAITNHRAGEPGAAFIGRLTGSVIFFFVLAFLASLIFRRTWRLGVRCAVILILALLVFLGSQKEASDKVIAEINRYANQQIARARDQAAHPGSPGASPDVAAEVAKLKSLSQAQGASDRILTDATAEMMQEIASRSKACAQAEHNLLALGVDPSRFSTLDDLQKRCEAVAACGPPIADYLSFLESLEDTMRTRLKAKGVSDASIEQYVAGMNNGSRLQNLSTYWRVEQTLISDLGAKLDLLKAQWGKWHLKDASTIVFDDGQEATSYNEILHRIQVEAVQEKAAQEKVLSPLSN